MLQLHVAERRAATEQFKEDSMTSIASKKTRAT
jgi:hypothetical protein